MKLTADPLAGIPAPRHAPPVAVALAPIMAAVLVGFLVVGLAIPVLPLHVHDGLGFGPFMVDLVAGSQFVAALFSRVWAGRLADERGAKHAVMLGLSAATIAGALYFASLDLADAPHSAAAVLIAGRAVLGGAESFIITGATIWGLARVGARHAGKVIAWMGTAMFAAFAAGGPLGSMLYGKGGFAAIAIATILAPIATLLVILPLHPDPPAQASRPGLLGVARRILLPGIGAALSSIGFGAVIAFVSLLFAARGWTPVWLAFSSFAGALIVARVLFGHLPDRVGGARVALHSLAVEAAGLALIAVAPCAALAATGAALAGFGYALVFPGFGAEAVRRAPPRSRGVAMGAFTAFLDLALGASSPVLGLLADVAGMGGVFLASAAAVLGAMPLARAAMRLPQARREQADGA